MLSPCYKCPNRTENGMCHCDCEKYLEYNQEREKIRNKRKQMNDLNQYFFDSKSKSRKKWEQKRKAKLV